MLAKIPSICNSTCTCCKKHLVHPKISSCTQQIESYRKSV